MAMELHVVVADSRLPDRQRWQEAVDALGFDLQLDPSLSVRRDTGFRPCTYRGQPSGFEFDTWPTSELLIDEPPELARRFAGRDRSANFRWGGDLTEMACALLAAAALAWLGDGVWFDPQEGTCLGPAEAIEQAKAEVAAAGV